MGDTVKKTKSYKDLYKELVKSDIKLTIGILVSNHIKYIRKGLEAIKPLLDEVPSELIVVDTVGEENSDGSLNVAKEYTDKIYHFDWINDFSAARNVAMEHARGEWFMYFDDDEYFDDVTEIINFFKNGDCDKYFTALYYTGDYVTPDKYSKAVACRMIRRTVGTRFVGNVHEQFNEAYSPVKQFNAFTHHFGYMYETPEQAEAKMKRNLTLLEEELATKGPNARVCAQIIGQLMGKDYEEAGKRCIAFIKQLEGTEELDTSLGQWLLTAHVRLMSNWGSLQGMLDIEKQLLENYNLQETARLVLAYQVAMVAVCGSEYKVAAERVRTYFEMLDWLNAHPDERTLQSQLDFPKYMMDDNLFSITKIGIICENHLKNYDVAYAYIKRLDFDHCDNIDEMYRIINVTLKEIADPMAAVEFYKQIYREELFDDPQLQKYLPEVVRKRSLEKV